MLKQIDGPAGASTIAAAHAVLGAYHLYCEGDVPLLFTENETNHARLHLDYPDAGPYVKDGINDYVVQGRQDAVNPERQRHQGRGALPADDRPRPVGDGAAAPDRPGAGRVAHAGQGSAVPFGKDFDETLAARLREADEFYRR